LARETLLAIGIQRFWSQGLYSCKVWENQNMAHCGMSHLLLFPPLPPHACLEQEATCSCTLQVLPWTPGGLEWFSLCSGRMMQPVFMLHVLVRPPQQQGWAQMGIGDCHGMTSLPLLHLPLSASELICLPSASSASALLQLWCVLVQLLWLCYTHSWTNCRSMPDLFGPGSHAKGCRLYTLSTFVLFAWSFFIDNSR